MNYRIVGDSCTDLPEELKKEEHFSLVALSFQIDENTVVDDETFDQKDFLNKIAASPNCPKSSCPSPEAYLEAFGSGMEDVYVITLSSKLSGSYNSAELAKKLCLEEHPGRNVEVFNSKSASVGQTLIAMKIWELVKAGKEFKAVVDEVHRFVEGMNTKFVIETLETLRKNGRLSNLKAILCNALNIKPVMGATPEGEIYKLDQARGMERALKLMADLVQKDVDHPEERVLGIAHCNNYERAELTKEAIMGKIPFKDCFIVDTAGVSSLYANDGGIIIAY